MSTKGLERSNHNKQQQGCFQSMKKQKIFQILSLVLMVIAALLIAKGLSEKSAFQIADLVGYIGLFCVGLFFYFINSKKE